ncbi:hypothetical protein [Rhodopseudomonas parapalustris]
MIKVIVTRTYDEKGIPDNKVLKRVEISEGELPTLMLDLAKQASVYKYNQEIVCSFPEDNTNVIEIEIYNGPRE